MVKNSTRFSKQKEKQKKNNFLFFLYKIDQERKEVEGIDFVSKSESLHQPLNKELQKSEETENMKT